MLGSGWQFADQTGQLGLSRPPTLLMTMMTLPKFGQKGGLRGQTWWIASLINDWSQLWGSLRTMGIILLGIKVLKVILHFYHVWSSGPVKQRLLSQQGWRLTINITIRENLLHWKIKRERGKNVSLGPPPPPSLKGKIEVLLHCFCSWWWWWSLFILSLSLLLSQDVIPGEAVTPRSIRPVKRLSHHMMWAKTFS